MSDPRELSEALLNGAYPFRITKNSLEKCECGHTIGFHHFNGWCKGAITDGCTCKTVRPVSLHKGEIVEVTEVRACSICGRDSNGMETCASCLDDETRTERSISNVLGK